MPVSILKPILLIVCACIMATPGFAKIAPKPSIQRGIQECSVKEIELVKLTNQVRKKAGLKPLKISGPLVIVARKHSQRMARKKKLAHLIKGKDFMYRLSRVGYTFKRAGENVGRSKKASAHVVDLWMKSSAHRNNILNPEFKDIGVGIYTNPDGER